MSNIIEFPIKNEELAKKNKDRLENSNIHDLEQFKTRRAIKERMDIIKGMLDRINAILKIVDTAGEALFHFESFYSVQKMLEVMGAQKFNLMAEKMDYEKKLEEVQKQYAKQGKD